MNAMPDIVHCSSLPRIRSCPASIEAPAVPIDSSGESSRIGSAVHAVLAKWIKRGYDPDALVEQAVKWQVDRDELNHLAYMGWKFWLDTLRQWHPAAETEVDMEAGIIKGRADVLSVFSV